jgi:hypothetical protein
MQLGFGAGTFYVDSNLVVEFTKLNHDEYHSFPPEHGQDYLILLNILFLPREARTAELLKHAADPTFPRLRGFALDGLGLESLRPAFDVAAAQTAK